MKYNLKRITKRAFGIYAIVNVLTYLFAHVAYLFASDTIGEIFEYASYYISKTVEFLAPPVIAAVALCVFISYGKGALLKFSLAVASARVFYAIPYYYIIFIYNHGYDSIESITLSIAASALVVLLTFIGTLASLGIYYLVLKHNSKRNGTEPRDALPSLMSKETVLDFLSPVNLPIFTFALSRFAFSLIMELIDTATFFIEYRSDYIAKEIITILANYTLLFVLLAVSYLLGAAVKNAVLEEENATDVSFGCNQR